MKAIILAAGRGSRLENLTENMPKCFVKLGDKRLIDWQIQSLLAAGLGDISVVVGYKKAPSKVQWTHR
jgi:choline kinase